MDIKDTLAYLKEYDIKNINPDQIKRTLLRRKDIMANIAVIVSTLIAVFNISGSKRQDALTLQSQIQNLEKKSTSVSKLKNSEEQLDKFVGSLPEGIVETNDIVDLLNNIGLQHGVRITSISPSSREKHEFYSQANIELDVSANNYSDLGLFVYDIEHSEYNLRVDEWSIKKNPRRSRRRRSRANIIEEPKDEQIEATCKIASLKIET